jgi:glycosyltransferase involved in cell wall biosynthesis
MDPGAASAGRRPRIAILTNYPVDHTTFTGGVATATAALLVGLRAHGREYEFHIIDASNPLDHDQIEEQGGIHFHFLSLPQARWARPRVPFRVIKAYGALRRIGPDLVHLQGDMALGLAATFAGYRCLRTIHGILQHEVGKRAGKERLSAAVDAGIERAVDRRVAAAICISGYAARLVGGARPTFAIPNAVHPRFLQLPPRPAPQTPRFLFVGVLAPLKRPADLLAAHAALRHDFPELETTFCGTIEDVGYERAMQRTVAADRIAGVHFQGHTKQAELLTLLQGTTALVLPSAQENMPMVIAEAMSCGVAVVATRVGGIPEMLEHNETGLLYEAGDIAGLTACLRRLLTEPDLAERLGRRAAARARAAYGPGPVAKATIAVYQQLLARQPLAAGAVREGA